MYKQGAALMLLLAVLVSSATFFPEHRFLSLPLFVIALIGSGIFGNGIYMNHIRKVAREALATPANLRMTYIEEHGGINKKGTAIAAVVCAAALVIFALVAKAVI